MRVELDTAQILQIIILNCFNINRWVNVPELATIEKTSNYVVLKLILVKSLA